MNLPRLLIACLLILPYPLRAEQQFDPSLLLPLRQAIESSSSFEDPYIAQVWLVTMSSRLKPFLKDPEQRMNLLVQIHEEAVRAGLSPELVISVIHVESLFDRYAISTAGARGLMQVMPFWKKELGRSADNLFDPAVNLRYGCTILAHYISIEKGNLQRALARYNGSLGKTRYPEKVLMTWEKHYFTEH